MNKNLYFAPFHGITTRAFRDVFFSHFGGIDTILTPFLPAGETFLLSEARFKDVFPVKSSLRDLGANFIVQLIGNKQKDMSDTVLYLHDKGFERINWNIACPMPQIIRKKRGCGLMPYPDEIERAVEDICKNTTAKFSIKMRLGMYNPGESLEIINRLNKYPLDFIAIHARLGTQLYSGNTDKESFRECFQLSKNQLCYNGDIFSVEDYQYLQTQFPDLNSCMLGRGLLQNPFLAEQIRGKAISKEEQQKRFHVFYEDLTRSYLDILSKGGTLNRLKELWRYFAVFFNLREMQLRELLQIMDSESFIEQTNIIHITNSLSF